MRTFNPLASFTGDRWVAEKRTLGVRLAYPRTVAETLLESSRG
jgi:hypothetical protein